MLTIPLAALVGAAVPVAVRVASGISPILFLGAIGSVAALSAIAPMTLKLVRDRPLSLTIGAIAVALSATTITFNGIRVVAFADVSDVLLAIALPFLVVGSPSLHSVPAWVWACCVSLVASALISLPRAGFDLNNVVPAFQMAGAIAGLTLAVIIAAPSSGQSQMLMRLWLLGAVIGCCIAVSDGLGYSNIGPMATGAIYADRVSGLSAHPNHLSLAVAMAIPSLVAVAVRPSFTMDRFFGLAGAGVGTLGLLLAGSRAGVIAAIAGLCLLLLLSPIPAWKWRLPALVALAGLGMAAATAVTAPTGLSAIDRLFGFSSVAESDAARQSDYSIAWQTISRNPFMGIGFDVARSAHDIYLQMLSAGGILALLGLLVYGGGVLFTAVRYTRRTASTADRLAVAALAAGLFGWLVAGFVQNLVYDRFLFIPGGLLVAFSVARGITVKQPVRPSSVPYRPSI